MNIAIFTNNYLPNPYGVSMSVESFRKEFEQKGHTVYIFAPFAKGYIDENKNVFRYPSIDFKFKGVRYPIAIPFSKKMDKILEELEINVIHSQHPNLLGWAAKKWAKKKNVPLIFTWHTLYDQYAHFTPLVPSTIAASWAIGNARRYANFADAVIVPTPSVKNILQNWKVTNENMSAIASGINEKVFENANQTLIRKKYLIGENESLLFLASRLTAEKNVKFLFETVLKILEKNEKIKFLIAGDGEQRGVLEKMAKEKALDKRVIFTGIIPAAQIKDYYAAADIFVHASKSETQGMILTEAMYMGLPIVAVDASGAKDLVRNNETGFLVKENEEEFASAVQKLVDDENLRKTFSQNAKKIAKESYTSQVCAEKMLEIYRKMIKTKNNSLALF